MLEVKKSLIPDAGLGVFATQDIDSDVELTEYYGLVVPRDSPLQSEYITTTALLYQYGFYTVGNVNQHNPLQCGQMINDYSKIPFAIYQTPEDLHSAVNKYHEESTKHANVKMIARSNKHYVYSIKKIKSGEELYYSYGILYWMYGLERHLKSKTDTNIYQFVSSYLSKLSQEMSLLENIHNFVKTKNNN